MPRRCIKTLLVWMLCAIISIAIVWFVPVLLCDIWRLECAICR